MSDLVIRGSCYCKAIRFSCTLPSRFVAHCHCNNCRRAHGAGFVTWAGFPDAQFAITDGEERLGHYRTETAATRSFCSTCGSMLFFRSPRWPGEVHVALGALDDPIDKLPTVHVYADRAPVWAPIADTLPRRGGESGTEPI
ncbi:MAG: GFA family protein [Planctomycetota bacterium]